MIPLAVAMDLRMLDARDRRTIGARSRLVSPGLSSMVLFSVQSVPPSTAE